MIYVLIVTCPFLIPASKMLSIPLSVDGVD